MSTLNNKSFFREDDQEDMLDEPSREYWDSGDGAAGCIFIAKDTGRILIFHRSRYVMESNTWGTSGGKVDEGETLTQAVEREIEEETGFGGKYKISPLWTFKDGSFQYHNYMVIVPFEFTPELNWENDDSSWVEFGEWPSPLHFGFKALIENAGQKIKRVVTLIKKKHAELLQENVEGNMNDITITPEGLIDDGVYGYKMTSVHSFISYGYAPNSKVFYIRMIQTPNKDDQNQGYAKAILETFFQMVKQKGGMVDEGVQTSPGNAYIKHVKERLANQYGVRIVKGRDLYNEN